MNKSKTVARETRGTGSLQRMVRAQLLYDAERRACRYSGGQVSQQFETWEQLPAHMKRFYARADKYFTKALRSNAEVSEGGTRGSTTTAAQSRPSLH